MLESSLERGLPISLSRWTDVAHWYMDWLRDMVTLKGYVVAPDPQHVVPTRWSLHPDDVFCLFFWTKNPSKLPLPLMTWLASYRVFVAVTITGWPEVEPRVPSTEKQLDGLRHLVDLLGPQGVAVRYSPVPSDFLVNPERRRTFRRILSVSHALGVRHVDVALLQPNDHWPLTYKGGEGRSDVLTALSNVASSEGMRLGVCSDDLLLLREMDVGDVLTETKCLNGGHLADRFGVDVPSVSETDCGCQLSLDPCRGPQFGCGSGCAYCYAPYTKVSQKLLKEPHNE